MSRRQYWYERERTRLSVTKRRPWEDARDVERLRAQAHDQGWRGNIVGSGLSRICVEFHERTPPSPEGHWTWEREYEAAESADVVGVAACRRHERDCLSHEEWTAAHLDGSVRAIITDFEHPVEPGCYVVLVAMWASRDYWTGEHDEGMDVVEIKKSAGNCKRYWRRRAHERKARNRAGGGQRCRHPRRQTNERECLRS